VAVVQSLHNFRLLCANAYLYRDGHVCADCVGRWLPWPGVAHACYRESRAASAVVAMLLTAHRAWHTWSEHVDTYIALTTFARDIFVQGGLPAQKIVVKPNFVRGDAGPGPGRGGYALFVGRLSQEKGVHTLLAAWEHLGAPLKIVGDGPLSGDVMEAVARHASIEWLGRQPQDRVHALMQEADVLLIPSLWYEGLPMVLVEAFAVGLPAIASNLGALASLVAHERTGRHFRPGDPQDLAAQVEWMFAHPDLAAEMRRNARAEFEARYTPERNYQLLMDIYQAALARSHN